MRDKKFVIALIVIVVLALALSYVVFIGPKIQGYLINKQTRAQENVVKTIVQIVDQQGYVVLGDGNDSVVLIKYQPPAQQQPQQELSNQEGA